jgi:hypothetical protein
VPVRNTRPTTLLHLSEAPPTPATGPSAPLLPRPQSALDTIIAKDITVPSDPPFRLSVNEQFSTHTHPSVTEYTQINIVYRAEKASDLLPPIFPVLILVLLRTFHRGQSPRRTDLRQGVLQQIYHFSGQKKAPGLLILVRPRNS